MSVNRILKINSKDLVWRWFMDIFFSRKAKKLYFEGLKVHVQLLEMKDEGIPKH